MDYPEERKQYIDGIACQYLCHIEKAEKPGNVFFAHFHYYIEMLYALSGHFRIYLNGIYHEFAAGDFTLSNAKTIPAPVIEEAFINIECTLKEIQDLSGAGIEAMVIGQVQNISVEENYAEGYAQRYGKEGFMMLVPAPQNLISGEPNQSAIASVAIEKYD